MCGDFRCQVSNLLFPAGLTLCFQPKYQGFVMCASAQSNIYGNFNHHISGYVFLFMGVKVFMCKYYRLISMFPGLICDYLRVMQIVIRLRKCVH